MLLHAASMTPLPIDQPLLRNRLYSIRDLLLRKNLISPKELRILNSEFVILNYGVIINLQFIIHNS